MKKHSDQTNTWLDINIKSYSEDATDKGETEYWRDYLCKNDYSNFYLKFLL